ncbi:hypothetical protein B0J18DRAFT_477273 [Chaetomium sp. MPI-SDFR-AT-0129]|nr:hypothetical protein B0J18DRAFT_477273 [Chaetomium sp. MPI-SDFR-AT-0129]
MAAVTAASQNSALDSGKADAAPLRTLSITTTRSHEVSSSGSSPASATSPSFAPTPTSSTSAVPTIAIRPNASTNPSSGNSSAMNSRPGSSAMSTASMSLPKTMCMTTKEWVIPPRPKPGRKPATDTPPTKRKAQNRAAQRAFRERRAARVGELEEQIEEDKASHDRTVRELQERISHLEVESQTLRSRCHWLESMLEKERQGRGSTASNWDNQQQDLENPTQRPQPPAPAPLETVTRHVPVAGPRPVVQPLSISQIVSATDEASLGDLTCGSCQPTSGSCACADEVMQNAELTLGCGKCSVGTTCECLEETLKAPFPGSDLKRPPSSPPSTSPEDKRQRSDPDIIMEADFTAMFASQNHREAAPSHFQPPMASIEPRDACGFCKDGTYCVCADAMISPASLPAPVGEVTANNTQTRTPPPSDNDVTPITLASIAPVPMEVTATGAIKLPRLRSLQQRQQKPNIPRPPAAQTNGGCGPNGPGTCAQCIADPKSGLFCRSLAANFQKNNPRAAGSAAPTSLRPTQQQPVTLPSINPGPNSEPAAPGLGLSLSCADAYKTLSSHRFFDEAADDIGSWLPKLRALPIPRPSHPHALGGRGAGLNAPGRAGCGNEERLAPIEVEAASIMSVLKDFDVRFGRGE